MKYSQASLGRVFVVRLEDGDIVHECLERFAREQAISAAITAALPPRVQLYGITAEGVAVAVRRALASTEPAA